MSLCVTIKRFDDIIHVYRHAADRRQIVAEDDNQQHVAVRRAPRQLPLTIVVTRTTRNKHDDFDGYVRDLYVSRVRMVKCSYARVYVW